MKKSSKPFIEILENETLLKKETFVQKVFLFPFRLYYKCENFIYEIKYFIQRGFRGYSDVDLWNMNFFLANLISEMTQDLAKTHYGLPNLNNEEIRKNTFKSYIKKDKNDFYYMSKKGWDSTLLKISKYFKEFVTSDDRIDEIKDKKKADIYYKKVMKNVGEAFRLLELYFNNLWD